MNETVVIDGMVELVQDVGGEVELKLSGSGEFGQFIALRDLVYPAYEGETSITPTAEVQILPTALKTTMDDITIAPIPNNYGLITWDGATLTVS